MYFMVSKRKNPETGIYSGYHRLMESYRNQVHRVCHRTLLNAGYLDELNTDQLNLIQKILTAKASNPDKPLFDLPYTGDPVVIRYVDEFYNRMVTEERIDVLVEKPENKPSRSGKDLQMKSFRYFVARSLTNMYESFMTHQNKSTHPL